MPTQSLETSLVKNFPDLKENTNFYNELFSLEKSKIYQKIIFILENDKQNFFKIFTFLYNHSLNQRKYDFSIYLAIFIRDLIKDGDLSGVFHNIHSDDILLNWSDYITLAIKIKDQNKLKFNEKSIEIPIDMDLFLTVQQKFGDELTQEESLKFIPEKHGEYLGIKSLEDELIYYSDRINFLINKFGIEELSHKNFPIEQFINRIKGLQNQIIYFYIGSFDNYNYNKLISDRVIGDFSKENISKYILFICDKIINNIIKNLLTEISLINSNKSFQENDLDRIKKNIQILDSYYFKKYSLFLKLNKKQKIIQILDDYRDFLYENFLKSEGYINYPEEFKSYINDVIEKWGNKINTAEKFN